MNRIIFSPKPKLDTALLIKDNVVWYDNKSSFSTNYFIPIGRELDEKIGNRVTVLGTYHPKVGKVKKKEIIESLDESLTYCQTMGIDKLLVADGDYFKVLSGCKAFEKHIGEKFDCVLPGYEEITVVPTINYTVVDMFPEKKTLLDKANKTAASVMNGTFSADDEFEFESYELIQDPARLREVFGKYTGAEQSAFPYLACDIETTGLYVGPTELLTIGFAEDEHNAFVVPLHDHYGDCSELFDIVKQFIKDYDGSLIFHNGLFDAKHIIYNMFMNGFSDIDGMLEGLAALNFDDTFILAYLELNSTVRPSLGLKDLTYDFLGDYAEDVKEAIKVPLEDLSKYNGKDVCGTFHVFNRFKDVMYTEIYTTIFKPSFKPLLKMMLNGMPLDLDKVEEVGALLEADLAEAQAVLKDNDHVQLAVRQLRFNAAENYNATHKVKKKTMDDFADIEFNPNSSAQLRLLLFDIMDFEPVDFTKTKAPKTDRASIKEFLDYATDAQKPVLDALVTISQAGIVLTTFISAFKELSITQDGHTTLHGSLVLGGTQSGRLSSRDPNMQNLPSNSKWGKAIKSCFVAPEGWLFYGADFNALEDKIGAILSKDPAKLKENLLGYDGHSLRAHAFFPEELEEAGLGDIDPDNPDSINRIVDEASMIRQNAKPVSFLKQYGGGAGKIQKVLKCSKARANEISDAYDNLYKVTLQFNAKNNDFARANGYIDCAFGLRLKTPRIKARDNAVSSAEERSSNNAKTQSWGMLMNRANNEYDDRIERDGMSHDVLPINTIHDAAYGLVRATPEAVAWVNKNLIECMEWQNHPDLVSEIKLGAELDIGPSWDKQYTLPNGYENVTAVVEAIVSGKSSDEIKEIINEN